MNKILISVLTLVSLAGCAGRYDYYTGDVRYVQDGADCVYYIDETGNDYSSDIRHLDIEKKIVYRNTMCRDLYARDTFDTAATRRDRRTVIPAADESQESADATTAVETPAAAPAMPPAATVPDTPCGCIATTAPRDMPCNMALRRRYIIMPTM